MSITPVSTSTPTSTTNTVSLLPKLSDADQKKFDTIKANLQSALDTVKNSKVDNGAQKRADAEQRIARIKAQIKALRQVHGLDAKMLARQLAQLGKELSSAVKEYVSAGGSDSGVSSAPAASASSDTANSSGSDTSAQGGSTSSAKAAVSGDSSTSTSTNSTAGQTTPQVTAANAYAQTQQVAVNPNDHSAEDRQFLKDVNEIKNELRGYSQQLRSALKSKFMPSSIDPDLNEVRQLDKSLDEVDHSLISFKIS